MWEQVGNMPENQPAGCMARALLDHNFLVGDSTLSRRFWIFQRAIIMLGIVPQKLFSTVIMILKNMGSWTLVLERRWCRDTCALRPHMEIWQHTLAYWRSFKVLKTEPRELLESKAGALPGAKARWYEDLCCKPATLVNGNSGKANGAREEEYLSIW